MAMRLYSDTDIQDIADAIRSKNGSTNTYKTSDMAAAILAISSTGGAGGSIASIASGTYTPTSDISSSSGVTLTHGLGVVPDLIVIYTTDLPWQSSVGTTNAILGCVAFVNAPGGTDMKFKNIIIKAGTTGTYSIAFSTTTYGISSAPTTSSFTINCNSSNVLIGGDTYNWIAVKFK